MRIDRYRAVELAAEMLKKAGFTLYRSSRVSESCYYHHPARPSLLLRLSAHKANKGPIGLVEPVLVNVSFTVSDERSLLTPTVVRNRVIWGIGYYFLADPKTSKYNRTALVDKKAADQYWQTQSHLSLYEEQSPANKD